MILFLLGGTGLFLLGMWMMTDGLRLAAGDALQLMLRSATSSPWRGLAAGAAITAIVQSSSAVTVATIGFVNAGLLNLTQSVWVIFGTNVGTTMTGWLVAAVGVKVDVVELALPLLGAGMMLRLAARARPGLSGFGQALAGFGAFFLGIGFLQQGFATAAMPARLVEFGYSPWIGIPVFLLVGTGLTILTQSSSAAIAIVLTASAGAGSSLDLAAAAVIGTNIGTTSTAALAAISATPPAKRVAGAHIAFNVLTAGAALLLFHPLLAASRWLVALTGDVGDSALTLAAFHTLFNGLGLLLVWPISTQLVAWLERRFVSLDEEIGRPMHLDATLQQVPQLALRGMLIETRRMSEIAHKIARASIAGERTNLTVMAKMQAGVLRLGQAVRAFIGQMSKGALTTEVADAIPDIIRGVQHLEELAHISVTLAHEKAGSSAHSDEAEIGSMRRLVLETLAADDVHRDDASTAEELDRIAAEIEAHYQNLKAGLLQRAGTGGLPVEAMERTLLHIRQMRRCAEVSRKARRRLGPWFRQLSTGDEAARSA
jgi:phosphate:Na+ symporter